MGLSLFAKVIFAQVAAVTIIAWILKVILNKNLIDLAIRRLEYWDLEAGSSPVTSLVITSHKKLKQVYLERIVKAVKKQFGDAVTLEYKVDRSMWGGMVVRAGQTVVEFSMKERLVQAFRK